MVERGWVSSFLVPVPRPTRKPPRPKTKTKLKPEIARLLSIQNRHRRTSLQSRIPERLTLVADLCSTCHVSEPIKHQASFHHSPKSKLQPFGPTLSHGQVLKSSYKKGGAIQGTQGARGRAVGAARIPERHLNPQSTFPKLPRSNHGTPKFQNENPHLQNRCRLRF